MSIKVFILAREEKIFHVDFFRDVLNSIPKDYEVVGAALVKNKDSIIKSMKYVYSIGGFKGTIKLIWLMLVKYADEALKNKSYLSVENVFKKKNIPVLIIQNPNDESFILNLSKYSPDIIYNSSPNILKKPLLSLPTLGCVNRHAGKLPFYRGIEPVFFAFLNGESSATITYHKMDEKIDGGEILWEHDEMIGVNDSVYTMYAKLFEASKQSFWHSFDVLRNGDGVPVDITKGEYYSYPSKCDIINFCQKGFRYI
jgi:methionyl-tRNA formyltransferase